MHVPLLSRLRPLALRPLVLSAAIAVPTFAAQMVAQPAAAEADDAATATRHVNVSALQSMLVEQIAKAACFADLGVNASANMAYLRGSFELYARAEEGLRGGNKSLGLVEETNPNMLQALDRVTRVSQRWRATVGAVAAGDGDVLSAQSLETILTQTALVTEATEELAERADRTYGKSEGVTLAQALRLKLAARQRMLSQRMAKDYCMMQAGADVAGHRAALDEAITLFDGSLSALIDGFPAFGLKAEADPARLARLKAVRSAWDDIKPLLVRAANGQAQSRADVVAVAWGNNLVLTLANAAVFAYETDGKGGS
ncbi:MAG: type IV pili methyl-accepting chemotaxis transducer N-terminal domain-containing protein [Pseudomonadota bacterium]